MPDPAPKIIRQPATVGWHENHSITCDGRRVRGVAKGTPRVTLGLTKDGVPVPGADRVSGLHGHERQASAHAPHGIRQWKP